MARLHNPVCSSPSLICRGQKVLNERACHKNHARQISMLFYTSEDANLVNAFVSDKWTDRQTDE